MKKISILGTEYTIKWMSYEEQAFFKDKSCSGVCDDTLKEIWVCKLKSHPSFREETENYCQLNEKEILRHEIIHAFLNESGLRSNSRVIGIGWAENEEMVDWIAIQFPKMFEIFKDCDCL